MIYRDFLKRFTAYEPTTIYWERLSIAEMFGEEEIQTVFNDISKEACEDYKLLTELGMALHFKCYEYGEIHYNSRLLNMYTWLSCVVNVYAKEYLNEDEFAYYYSLAC